MLEKAIPQLQPSWLTTFIKQRLHADPLLLITLCLLSAIDWFILYSASNANSLLVIKQVGHALFAFLLMLIAASIPPRYYQRAAPWLFITTLLLLVAVLIKGHVGQGAQRWIAWGILHFQPSELMKLALPIMLARYLSQHPLPPSIQSLAICFLLIVIPALLTAKQPDLGTAILITLSGMAMLLLAGIRWTVLVSLLLIAAVSSPLLWHSMHAYQRARLLTFLNPERDPLGGGYHIIQSKIAIGSGGILGKGWLHGTQTHAAFLPAHTTDFIFAVSGEELGLVGCGLLLALFFIIFTRCLYMSTQAKNGFSRLLAGSLSLSFMFAVLMNVSMVLGVLPVVGVPLPLVSYGGSAMLTTLISFGIIMSIHTHPKLWLS